MATKDPFMNVLRNFFNSLKRDKPAVEVGKDYLGNRYFEYVPGPDSTRRKQRWFKPVSEEDFDARLPKEWELWIRYRRRDAPTAEEVEQTIRKQQAIIANARKLEGAKKSQPASGSSFPDLGYEEEKGSVIRNANFNDNPYDIPDDKPKLK